MTAIAPHDIHDAETLGAARALLDAAADPRAMQREVLAAVARNEQWRGNECINLLAPEALVSPTVRAAALRRGRPARRRRPHRPGQPLVRRHEAHRRDRGALRRAAQAAVQEQLRRAPPGREHDRQHGRLRRAHRARRHGDDDPAAGRRPQLQPPRRPRRHPRPEHRRRPVRRAGARGRPRRVRRARRASTAEAGRARRVDDALPAARSREIAEIASEWGGKVFFDGAHQLGLIAGGQFQDPLAEGAAVMTGSAGKTFSGPQSGVMVWNDPELTKPLLDAVFPALAATHQVNRVAALAAAAAELLAFGPEYMAAVVANAQTLAARAAHPRRARARRPQGLHAHPPGDRRRARVRRRPRGRPPARQGQHHHQQEPAAQRPARATGTARAACASAPPRSPASAWARSRCRRSPT